MKENELKADLKKELCSSNSIFDTKSTNQWIEYAKNNKVTVNSIFLAAYIKALIGEAGKKTLGITLSGREDVSEEDMDFIDFFNDLFDGFEKVSESEDEEYLDFDDE